MNIQAIIFDFGGVLVRMADTTSRRRWAERLGVPLGELEAMVFESEISRRAMVGLAPEIAIWQGIAQRFGLNDAAMAQCERDFWHGEQLDGELVALLHNARPHYRTAILSNAWSDARTAFTQKFRLHEAVDLMVLSAEEGIAKPDPRIYERTLQRLNVRPEEAIFVDDLAENVAAALALGIHALQYRNTPQTIAHVRALLDGHTPAP